VVQYRQTAYGQQWLGYRARNFPQSYPAPATEYHRLSD
jgi:hypothetical protein